MQFQISSLSDTGTIRENNQDSFLELNLENFSDNGLLLVVADGMGGHRGGEVASKTVVDTIENFFKSSNTDHESDTLNFLKESIVQANDAVINTSAQKNDLKGMGSTCTAVLIVEEKAFVAHIGDSRAYLIRGKKISQLTRDHTLVEKMVESGILTKEQAKTSPHRNMLTKAVGITDDIEVETYEPIKAVDGDVYFLCSDGLTEYLDDDEICSITNLYEPEKACNLLVKIANKRGGRDNITVQITKIQNSIEKFG